MADKWIQLQSADSVDNLFPTSRLELVWTNSSPSSTYGNTTALISNVADYKAFIIVVKEYISTDRRQTFFIVKGCEQVIKLVPYSATPYYIWVRECAITSAGIMFSACYGMSSYSSYQSTPNNNYIIPHYIYGIK